MSDRDTQVRFVLHLLKSYGTVSAHDLLVRHGIARAAARIWDLKQAGHNIETIRGRRLEDGTQEMASYRLVDVEPAQPALPW